MQNWIFVINDTKTKLEQRVSDKKWPIYKFTKYKKQIQNGDNVIFYMAGSEGKKFVGVGRIASELQNAGSIDFMVALSDTKLWADPVSMDTVLAHLQFITNKTNWGVYFQGGVIRLPDEDYKLILSKTIRHAS